MILTRIGEGSKMVINGDPDQSDLGIESGLNDVVSILRNCSPSLEIVHLSKIVRSKIVGEILDAFENKK
jgi:phosphate starvation-inducible PhoH-like protein